VKGTATSTGNTPMLSSCAPLFLIIKGLALALFLSLAIIIVLTAVMYWTDVSEKLVPYVIVAGSLTSLMAGSFFVGRKTTEKGWLKGGLTGLLYVVILLIFASFTGDAAWHNCFTKMFLGFSLGALGGIIGINT